MMIARLLLQILSFFVFLFTPAALLAANIAPLASVQCSSENAPQGQLAIKAVDTVIAGSPADPTREWATQGELAGAWISLSWALPHKVDRVVLYDRPNLTDRIRRGTLTFSDGSSIPVGLLTNNGSGNTFNFPAKTITWVKFTITRAVGTATGLAEFEVFGVPLQPPVASFSAGPLSGTAPLSVSFTDTSTGTATVWRWDFGDGATSSERNPVHVYTLPGTYSVALTVNGAAGTDSTTRSDIITVLPAPPAVRIAAPADGTAFIAPASIPITATASPTTGAAIGEVRFLAGSETIGTDASSPYEITWSGVPPGEHHLTAEVIDSVGGTALSAPVGIRVYAPSLPPPPMDLH